jgi:VanZ family protein
MIMSERIFFSILSCCYIAFLYFGSSLLRQLLMKIQQMVGDSLNIIVTSSLIAILLLFLYFRRIALQRQRIALTVLLLSCYGLTFWYLHIPEERMHLLQYGLLTYFFSGMLPNRIQGIHRFILVVSLVTLVGAGDEVIQALRPDRVGDLRDVVINGISGFLAQSLLLVTSGSDTPASTTTPKPSSLPNL